MGLFGKSLKRRRAELAAAEARLSAESDRQAAAMAGVDRTMAALDPLAADVVRLQNAVWARMSRGALDDELAELRRRHEAMVNDPIEARRLDWERQKLEMYLRGGQHGQEITPRTALIIAAAVAVGLLVKRNWLDVLFWLRGE